MNPVSPVSPVTAPIIRTFLVWFAMLALAGSQACRRSHELNGLSETRFVAVMAALKQVRDRPGVDSAQRAHSRDSILQKEGLTPAQLEGAAKQLAQNPARAQTVWQAIERRANDTAAVKAPSPGDTK
jgi:hypothetical protein